MADIEFKDLSCFVDLGFRKDKKQILHNINGKFTSRKLIGILGPSGSGKTTLLNILSGYVNTGIQGEIYVNGRLRNLETFKRSTCYITQESYLQPLLTVSENMEITADLKLGPYIRKGTKKRIAKELLEALGLAEAVNTSICKLSGGEKKRLSIALELISDPKNIFLDEPTTGLDSSSCSRFMLHLKALSTQSRTVVCTIHQASASIFQLFDLIYVLKEGRCLYQGERDELIPFLEEAGMPCPLFHNPADYVVELASGDYGEEKSEDLVIRCLGLHGSPQDLGKSNAIEETQSNSRILELPFNHQLTTLLGREYLKAKRNPCLTYLRLVTSITNSLVMSCIFWKVGSDGGKVWFNYNAILGFVLHLMMPSLMLTILAFPSEVMILRKEHFNRWYSLRAFYTAITLIDLPISIIYCMVSNAIIYYMTEQPMEWWRFSMFSSLGFLICIVAQSIGLLVGVLMDVTNGTFVGSALSAPMMIFGGFFVTFKDVPPFLGWLTHLSYLRYGVEGMVGAVNGYDRPSLPCHNQGHCPYKHTNRFLDDMGIQGDRFWTDATVLISIFILLRIVTYYAMKYKLRCTK